MDIVERHDELGDAEPTKLTAKSYLLIVLTAVVALTILLMTILIVAKHTRRRKIIRS